MPVPEKHGCQWGEEPGLCFDRTMVRLTELDPIVPEVEPGEDHLSETKARSKRREKADWEDPQGVDADNRQCRVNEAEPEDGLRQCS